MVAAGLCVRSAVEEQCLAGKIIEDFHGLVNLSIFRLVFSRELWRLYLVYRYHFCRKTTPSRNSLIFYNQIILVRFFLSISIQQRSICELNFTVLFLYLYLLNCCSKTYKIAVYSHNLVLRKSYVGQFRQRFRTYSVKKV